MSWVKRLMMILIEGHGDSSVVMMGVRSNTRRAATTTDQAKTTPGPAEADTNPSHRLKI